MTTSKKPSYKTLQRARLELELEFEALNACLEDPDNFSQIRMYLRGVTEDKRHKTLPAYRKERLSAYAAGLVDGIQYYRNGMVPKTLQGQLERTKTRTRRTNPPKPRVTPIRPPAPAPAIEPVAEWNEPGIGIWSSGPITQRWFPITDTP